MHESSTCVKCGAANAVDDRFCIKCGAGLAAASGPARKQARRGRNWLVVVPVVFVGIVAAAVILLILMVVLSAGMNSAKANNRYASGNEYLDEGEYSEAVSQYTQAIELRPNFKEAYNNRALARRYLGDYARAIDDYTQALEIDDNYARAYYGRGLTYVDMQDYDHALADLEQALTLTDDSAFKKDINAYIDEVKQKR